MLQTIKRTITAVAFIAILGAPLTGFTLNTATIDINSSSRVELQNIRGIGPTMANKIVSYREQHGQFEQITDLCNVQGIGKKSLKKMANQMCVK